MWQELFAYGLQVRTNRSSQLNTLNKNTLKKITISVFFICLSNCKYLISSKIIYVAVGSDELTDTYYSPVRHHRRYFIIKQNTYYFQLPFYVVVETYINLMQITNHLRFKE